MRKIKETLRLKWACGLSNQAIAEACRIARSTVREYVRRAGDAGLSWPLPDDLSDDDLHRRLYPRAEQPAGWVMPLPDWRQVHTELCGDGVTLQLVWNEYHALHPDGYRYSRFCDLYRAWAAKLHPTMRLSHKAGERCFIDYAGMTLPVVDPETGEMRQAQIFVAVLGASSYTYAEAQWNQDLPNWIAGHVRAFAFWGGCPRIAVVDNAKVAVRHPSRYEPELNPSYVDLAQHYGIAVVPARVRKPRDKSKVEVGVQVVERWVLAPLRKLTLIGLAAANDRLWQELAALNNRQMRHLGRSRHELFETLDRPALKPLPDRPYELAIWKTARVNIDYHVEFDHHFYSVPYTLVHQEMTLRTTLQVVEVFHKGQRVVAHVRSYVRGGYTTLPEHMPEGHRQYAEWTPERIVQWAQTIGPDTARLVEAVVSARTHPEQGYRSCLGILRLAPKYSPDRLEAAAVRALHFGVLTYNGVKNILDANLDAAPLDEAAPGSQVTDDHVRGRGYYR